MEMTWNKYSRHCFYSDFTVDDKFYLVYRQGGIEQYTHTHWKWGRGKFHEDGRPAFLYESQGVHKRKVSAQVAAEKDYLAATQSSYLHTRIVMCFKLVKCA